MKSNDIIGFTETKMNPSDSICEIIKTLNFLNIDFYKNEYKFSSSAYRYRNDVSVLHQFDANGFCIFSFKKYALL